MIINALPSQNIHGTSQIKISDMKTANKRKTHKANTVEKRTQTVDRLYYVRIKTVVMLP